MTQITGNVTATHLTWGTVAEVLQNIDEGFEYIGYYNTLCMDATGWPHIFYMDENNDPFLLHAYQVDSETWATEIVDETPNSCYGAISAVYADSIFHVSYIDSDKYIRFATGTTGSWATEIIPWVSYSNYYVKNSVFSDNSIGVSAYDGSQDGLAIYTKSGTEWASSFVSSLYTSYWGYEIDNNDIEHVSFHKTLNSIWYATRSGTGSWATEQVGYIPSAGTYYYSMSMLSLDSNDIPYIISQTRDGKYLQYAIRSGETWATSYILDYNVVIRPIGFKIDTTTDIPYLMYIDYNNGKVYETNASGSWATTALTVLDDLRIQNIEYDNGFDIIAGFRCSSLHDVNTDQLYYYKTELPGGLTAATIEDSSKTWTADQFNTDGMFILKSGAVQGFSCTILDTFENYIQVPTTFADVINSITASETYNYEGFENGIDSWTIDDELHVSLSDGIGEPAHSGLYSVKISQGPE